MRSLILLLLLQTGPVGKAVIAGRVVDDEGRPMSGAAVQALSYADRANRGQLAPRGNAVLTNDRGEFRVFRLDPGEYYVIINPPVPRPAFPAMTLGYFPSNPDESFVPTYYPGTPDLSEAEPVTVGSGEIDMHAIQMASLMTHRIRGRIAGRNDGGVLAYSATLRAMEGSYRPFYQRNLPQLAENGEFEFPAGLQRGRYRLFVILRSITGKPYFGSAIVSVDDAEANVGDVGLTPGITVQGHVEIDTDSPGGRSALSVSFIPDPSFPTEISTATDIRSNGTFQIDNIFPERYSIRLNGLHENDYLAAVQIQGQDVSPDNADLLQATSPVSMVLMVRHRPR